jgi:hypothetical protein
VATSANTSARSTESDPKLRVVTPQHREALWRFLRVLGASSCDAEDLVQEAFLVALRRPDFDGMSAAAVFTFGPRDTPEQSESAANAVADAIATLPLLELDFGGSLTKPLMRQLGVQPNLRKLRLLARHISSLDELATAPVLHTLQLFQNSLPSATEPRPFARFDELSGTRGAGGRRSAVSSPAPGRMSWTCSAKRSP